MVRQGHRSHLCECLVHDPCWCLQTAQKILLITAVRTMQKPTGVQEAHQDQGLGLHPGHRALGLQYLLKAGCIAILEIDPVWKMNHAFCITSSGCPVMPAVCWFHSMRACSHGSPKVLSGGALTLTDTGPRSSASWFTSVITNPQSRHIQPATEDSVFRCKQKDGTSPRMDRVMDSDEGVFGWHKGTRHNPCGVS